MSGWKINKPTEKDCPVCGGATKLRYSTSASSIGPLATVHPWMCTRCRSLGKMIAYRYDPSTYSYKMRHEISYSAINYWGPDW